MAHDKQRRAAPRCEAPPGGQRKVIDHERVIGIRDGPMEAVAVYEVRDGLIRNVWFFFPAQHLPPARGS